MSIVRLLARPLLATVFVANGVESLRTPGGRTQAAAPLIEKISAQTGLPNDPELMVRANGAVMALAGAMLATGKMPRVAGSLIAASLVPTTVAGHAFWSESDPAQRKGQLIQFQKNLGLLGGALLAAVDTDGKPGLGWRARNAARQSARSAKQQAKLAKAEAKAALS